MLVLFYCLIGSAILAMIFALVQVIALRRVARGGPIGRAVNLMLAFILFFFAGYAAAPFAPALPHTVGLILTATVFLMGAIFVILVLRLIDRLIKRVYQELKI